MEVEAEEIWKDVVGYEGYYQVSSHGRVKSMARLLNCRINKTGKRLTKEKIMKLSMGQYGYYLITLQKDRSAFKTHAHRIVAQAFVPNPENKPQVNHKNGIKTYNHYLNLEWATGKENTQHAILSGRHTNFGERHHSSKLTAKIARDIKYSPERDYILAKKYNVNQTSIYSIRKGRSWKNV